MRKITSVLLGSVVVMGLFSTSASASIKKGSKLYLKNCKKCHGNGAKGAAMHTQAEWLKFFENDAAALVEAHKSDEKAMKFFNKKKFKTKYAPNLKDFLHEYGSDSGNVPSCG